MTDVFQYYGNDIGQSSTGDVLPTSGTEEGKQRVLRRLLTNQGEYLWHPDYGAGVPAFVGQNLDIAKIKAVIRGQMLLEAVVAKSPEPVIVIQQITGGIACSIQYEDAVTSQPVTLAFDVTK
jgi:phage baseplate assembly protein W